ncbi:DUF2975 domain-containing protein [Mucilaginibacter sp. 44-25]|mgnify:CR=1 FL=1|uniref:DUF2975 domain-containing protein n=1 Tax=Mucilaginibacter sp. 44-25 TaxID=1895794 RepID=UPI00095B7289|nr:DUF2975 domain-containing protein [Mucilaginibacter sp. 44-25]OJW16443.1 MAG: hypothetical protein BGO48_09710 [Mucilaginibacter sp. 44-25]
MKLNLSTNRLVNVTLIVVFAFLAAEAYYLLTNGRFIGQKRVEQTFTAENVLPPIDSEAPDNLPYDQYQDARQLVQIKRDLKNGEWLAGGGVKLGWTMATAEGQFCDTCTITHTAGRIRSSSQYYIKLPSFQLNPQPYGHVGLTDSKFHVEGGQAYVRKWINDKVIQKSYGQHFTIRQVDEPVKFRYNSKENCVMIPVSSAAKNICNIILMVIGVLLIVYIFYLVGAFLKFIIDVSTGLTFTTQNVNRLKLIAFSLLSYPLITLLLVGLSRLIFSNYFTDDLMLNPAIWSGLWPLLIAGTVFLLLFKAFKQGQTLKLENDLTV